VLNKIISKLFQLSSTSVSTNFAWNYCWENFVSFSDVVKCEIKHWHHLGLCVLPVRDYSMYLVPGLLMEHLVCCSNHSAMQWSTDRRCTHH